MKKDRQLKIVAELEESIRLKEQLKEQSAVLEEIADLLVRAFKTGKKVLLFGNGGSAADAQHIAAELEGRFFMERPPLPAIALTVNTSSLTAIANDYGYESVFARQVRGLAAKGDVVIGITTSGNSPNVIEGLAEARKCGALTVAFTGAGGRARETADYALTVSSSSTPRIQEVHITAGHIICRLVEESLFGDNA